MKMITYSAALKYRTKEQEAITIDQIIEEILEQLPLDEEKLREEFIKNPPEYIVGSEFNDCEDQEAIAHRMEDIILEEFKSELDQFGRARLRYLACTYTEEDWDLLQDGYIDGTLINHLLKVQNDCWEWILKEEPKMKKSWGLTPQMQVEEPRKWEGLYNNLLHELHSMAKDMFCYI